MGREVYSVEVSDGRVCLHPHRELPTPSQQVVTSSVLVSLSVTVCNSLSSKRECSVVNK